MAGILTNEITPTSAAVFIPETWAKKAQLAVRKSQVLAGTVDTQYEAEMSSGRILHIAHVLNLSVNSKSASDRQSAANSRSPCSTLILTLDWPS